MKKYYWFWLLECLLADVQRIIKKMVLVADLVKHKCLESTLQGKWFFINGKSNRFLFIKKCRVNFGERV